MISKATHSSGCNCPARRGKSKVGHWFSRPQLRFRSRPGHSGGFPAHRPETSGPRNVSQPPQRPPIKPCMPFSGTRLSDIVHCRACAVP
jgi:hypothetical protein